MSIIAFKAFDSNKGVRQGDILGYWLLASGDTAMPLLIPRYADKSVHIFGTFGGATVAMKGSNDPDLVSFDNIYDFEGTDISQTAARKPWIILPNVYALKPTITGGDGTTSLKVAIVGRGSNI
jgi:hypothetical protein